VRARFLRRRGGGVGTDELRELLGVDGEPAGQLPTWFDEWAQGSRLPSAKAAAPSTWA
jgi:hypothetical protein